jgi:hypothetical protein
MTMHGAPAAPQLKELEAAELQWPLLSTRPQLDYQRLRANLVYRKAGFSRD